MRERRFQPSQALAASFALVILAGTLLLMMPFSTRAEHISFIDALFTSTSAVCVTGLLDVKSIWTTHADS
jgi:trk system potassium uptake protein TrkH